MSLKKLKKKIRKELDIDVQVERVDESIKLSGEVDSWDKVVSVGLIAGKEECIGVINNLRVPGLKEKPIEEPILKDLLLDGKEVDVLIIGAGITGASIARELSKWDISVLVVDKESDVAMHASSRNDGMIHPGLAAKPGTLKAKYNVLGNAMYDLISTELGVEFKRVGSLVLFGSKKLWMLKRLVKRRIKQNKVPNTRFINKKELYKIEPNLKKGYVGALELKTTGSLSPYKLVIAYLENAIENGVELSLNTIVKGMELSNSEIIKVQTNRGIIYPKVVVNAAGTFADKIASMADDAFFTIHPRQGEALILDKKKGSLIKHNLGVFKIDTKNNSKGGGIVKTVEDNLLVGPTAKEIIDREDFSTSQVGFNQLVKKQLPIIDDLNKGDVITYFTGIRAATYKEDFIIQVSSKIGNLVHAAGIQSPGLASAPAISTEIAKITTNILKDKLDLRENQNFNPYNKPIKDLQSLSIEERQKLIEENSDYGKIICRCEEISKGEIIDAINRNIPATSIDAIKRRVRATGGRCQGGFCMPLIMEIIAEETNKRIEDVTKSGESSKLLYGRTK